MAEQGKRRWSCAVTGAPWCFFASHLSIESRLPLQYGRTPRGGCPHRVRPHTPRQAGPSLAQDSCVYSV